jgi:hypothetical protein
MRARVILLVLLLSPVSCEGDAAPEPRCQSDDTMCFRNLAEENGYPIRGADVDSELNNVAFGAMYSYCFQSATLGPQLERATDDNAAIESYMDKIIEDPFLEPAIAGCTLAAKDRRLM